MKSCLSCKYADWKKTAGGKLHPSGVGWCLVEIKLPPLPASKYWLGHAPKPSGGHISRKEMLNDHCPYFAKGEVK